MDKESIRAGATYKELEAQHFNGGYFSEKVKLGTELFKQLTVDEKQTVFADTFNAAYSLAVAIRTHYRFDEEAGEIDLSNEGLGTVAISLTYLSEDEAIENFDSDGVPAYKGIRVETSFGPRDNEEPVFANLDGTLSLDDYPKIDQEIPRLLDAKETLEFVSQALWQTPNVLAAA